MKRINPGDIIAIRNNDKFYYAFILDKIKLFGGNWTFVLHYTSDKLSDKEEVLKNSDSGFHAFVDFIYAKRENRIVIVSTKNNFKSKKNIKRLKAGVGIYPSNPKSWKIMDLNFKDIKKIKKLNKKQLKYPYAARIEDSKMCNLVDAKWTPKLSIYEPYLPISEIFL